MENSIEIERLVKRFGNFVAVNGISLDIKKGEVFGLLGPNGAGKTTTISMILGIVKPTEGKITINGIDSKKETNKLKSEINLMAQETIIDPDLTAKENLYVAARLYHINNKNINESIKKGLEDSELLSFANKKAGSFSGGMKRRLYLAKCLINKPKIIILDEPTTGLDIQNRNKLWDVIKSLQKEGVTTILTTQYLEEADKLCNRIAIIDKGKVIAIGTPSELKRMVSKGQIIEIVFKKEDVQKAAKILLSSFNIKTNIIEDRLEAIIENDAVTMIPKIIKELEKFKISVLSLSLHLPTMDDVFLKLTGSKIRDSSKGTNDEKIKIKK
jgi:ABC-2 type transport system ATP-binding protein